MNMKNSGNRYGFSTNTDTHMIKNSEWGAVAYLSHSKYGTCTSGSCKEIGLNNNSNFITGCGANAGSSSSTTCNSYNTSNGVLASTTFNIYGVYDMSGCSWEYLMSNIVSKDGVTMMSGNISSLNSGYSGILYNGGLFSGISYPNSKYYDKYSYSESYTSRVRSKLGDGIKEVFNTGDCGWYDDIVNIIFHSNPWSARGGRYNNTKNAGLFRSNYCRGDSDYSDVSTRFIIVP